MSVKASETFHILHEAVTPLTSSFSPTITRATESISSLTPRPTHTHYPTRTTTPTEWIKTFPTKKALLIYGTYNKTQYTGNFIEWGDFYLEPYVILYEDGQLILTNSYLEKHISQAEVETIITRLKQLGLPQMQEIYEVDSNSIFTVPPDLDYNPSSSNILITLDENGPITIRYQDYWKEHLIQPMKEIVSYLNSFSTDSATFFQPDRLLVAVNSEDQEFIWEGEPIIPWPQDVTSPLHRSYGGVLYLEGIEALRLFKAAGEKLRVVFSFEGENYIVYLRPILPHECHIYHYYSLELPPEAQPFFTCDDW